jgi:hypothetical protein
MSKKTEIARADILDLPTYDKQRNERRKAIAEVKARRRVPVGPNATFYFECYETMLYQIQEMLRAERGGDEQLTEELGAYNPLVPKGSDLVATVMFEINDPVERNRFLSQIGNVEKYFLMEVAGEKVAVRPEEDLERTNEAGKTSSIHFLHFDLTPGQIAKFKTPGTRIMVGVDHPHYGHVAIMSEETRAALSEDLAG